MTATYADSRPPGIDVPFRPGNTLHLEVTGWPAGSLAGRTFTSTLGATTLALAVVGDIITIDATEAQTAAVTDPAAWLLTETTAGASNDLIIGTWSPSTRPGTPTSLALAVTVGAVEVAVTVVSGQASIVALGALHQPWVTRPASWGDHWFTAREEADTRLVNVHIWGDSIGSGLSASNMRTLSWAGLVDAALRSAYGDGGSGWLHHELATKTGTWTAILGMGGVGVRATAAASIAWSDVRGPTVRLHHRNTGTGAAGTFRWRVDGGSFTNVTPPTGFTVEPGRVEITGLTDTGHLVEVEWVSGTVEIFGCQGLRATGVNVARLTQSGRAAADFTLGTVSDIRVGITNTSATATSTSPAFTPAMVGRFISGTGIPTDTTILSVAANGLSATMSANATATNASLLATLSTGAPSNPVAATMAVDPFLGPALGRPDLVIVAYGTALGTLHTADTFKTGLSMIFNEYTRGGGSATYDYSPDFVVLQNHLAGSAETANTIARRLNVAVENAAWAAGIGGAFVDIWGMGRRSLKYWDDLGFLSADDLHPSDAGHAAMADPIIDLLTAA